MTRNTKLEPALLRVLDALDHPHGNRILRTRVLVGTPPTLDELKGSRLRAWGPDGTQVELRIIGFPVFGGEPSDSRIRSTRRVDLVVEGPEAMGMVSATWELQLTGT